MAIANEKEKEILKSYLNLNFRDNVLDLQSLNFDITDVTFITMKNTNEVIRRIEELEPARPKLLPSTIQTMNKAVVDLIKDSVSPINLSRMDVAWTPWL